MSKFPEPHLEAVHLGPHREMGRRVSAGDWRNSFPAAAYEIPKGPPRNEVSWGDGGEEYTIVRQNDILAIVE